MIILLENFINGRKPLQLLFNMASELTKKAGRPAHPKMEISIVQASAKLFFKHGFDNTSISMIAKEANITRQTFYRYFSTKEEIFKKIISNRGKEFPLSKFESLAEGVDIEVLLSKFGTTFYELINDEKVVRMFRHMAYQSINNPELGEIFYNSAPRNVIKALKEYLLEYADQLNIEDYDLAAEQFLSLVRSANFDRNLYGIERPKSRSKKKYIDMAVKVFLAYYKAEQ